MFGLCLEKYNVNAPFSLGVFDNIGDLLYSIHLSISYVFIQVNNRDRITWIGATNNDEMCNFYVMYWVYGKQQVHPDICFSAGPPEWSWHKSAGLRNIPEKEASTVN